MNKQAMLPVDLNDDGEYVVNGLIHPLWGTTRLNIITANEGTAYLLQKAGHQTCLNPAGDTVKVYVPRILLNERESSLSFMLSHEPNHTGLYLSYDAEGDVEGLEPEDHIEDFKAHDGRTRVTLNLKDHWVEAEVPLEPIKRDEMINVMFHTTKEGDVFAMGALVVASHTPIPKKKHPYVKSQTLCTILSNTPGITPLEHGLPPVHTAQVFRPAFGQARA